MSRTEHYSARVYCRNFCHDSNTSSIFPARYAIENN